MMAENKTKPTDHNVEQFLTAIEDDQKREDSFSLLELMKQVTGMEPQMWGTSIVGFGLFHYKYESGREGDMVMAGFSPRKQNLTIYNMGYMFQGAEKEDLFTKLGKHTSGKGCLYIKRLSDVDLSTLKLLIEQSFKHYSEQAKA